MKRWFIILLLAALVAAPAPSRAQAPHEAGGFVLGQNVSAYQDSLLMETSMPIRYSEYLREVEIKDLPGFKSGLIGYGDCASPGRIVWIKLKYRNQSKEFFEELLERFKKKFGEPEEWKGDPFKVVQQWKWSFVDADKHRITLLLHHNTRDEDEKIGNAIKLTDRTLEEMENRCYCEKHPERNKETSRGQGGPDWESFIPR